MNENLIANDDDAGTFRSIVTDDGVQRAAAGVVVALVVSTTKYFIFGGSK